MTDRASGLLLGLAIGDALGMPIDGLSHQNVRTYYKGIKGYRADEKRGELEAGQWTAHTQNARALAAALTEYPGDLTRAQVVWRQRRGVSLRRPTDRPYATGDAAACAAPLGAWWARTKAPLAEAIAWTRGLLMEVDVRPDSLVAAVAIADAARRALGSDPDALDGAAFMHATADAARAAEAETDASGAVSSRIDLLAGRLFEFPLDLHDLAGGNRPAADEAVLFALAMAARGPSLAEASLLAAINVGGAAAQIGAVTGALLGAFNSAGAFPEEWREGIEASGDIAAEGDRLAEIAS
ncbi:MAG: ADP-ribosylglycohydrolase family protein [Bacteroidota bacterium]